jgi:hypothetical protein
LVVGDICHTVPAFIAEHPELRIALAARGRRHPRAEPGRDEHAGAAGGARRVIVPTTTESFPCNQGRRRTMSGRERIKASYALAPAFVIKEGSAGSSEQRPRN